MCGHRGHGERLRLKGAEQSAQLKIQQFGEEAILSPGHLLGSVLQEDDDNTIGDWGVFLLHPQVFLPAGGRPG